MTGVRGTLSSLILGASLAGPPPALAANPGLAGDYVCRSGCRLTDAPPSIAIAGAVATCMSELGGIFVGAVLSDTAVSCFNMTGALSADGQTIVWSNGAVWERRHPLQRPGQP